MLKRIITSLCACAVLFPVLIFSHTWVFPAAISLVAVICLYELFHCMGVHKNIALTLPVYLCGAALPVLMRMPIEAYKVGMIAFMAAALCLLYGFALSVWSHGKLPYDKLTSVLLTAFYIVAALTSIIYIRDFGEEGQYLYFLIFIGAWITDIFAYFTGVFFGKHKLIEDVSPKKTIEGSIGGTLFCSLGFVVLGLVVDIFFERNANLVFLAVGGVIIAVIAQIGDLIMSLIKRQYRIKDYGRIFPGHGGMLDRFDSILAVSVGVALMCMFSELCGIGLM